MVTRAIHLSDGPGTLAFFFDITEQRRAQEELRQSHEHLRALFEASPVPIMMLDTEGRVVMWNGAAEATFG